MYPTIIETKTNKSTTQNENKLVWLLMSDIMIVYDTELLKTSQ